MPEWATLDTNLPSTGQPNKVRPREILRQMGWDAGQDPTAEELNELLNNIYKWISYLGDTTDGAFLLKSNDLSDVASVTTSRTNLGLKTAAVRDVATNLEVSAGTSNKLIDTVGLMSVFGKRVFTTNDYVRIPDVAGGFILQWCQGAVVIGGEQVTTTPFPIVFPNSCVFAGVFTKGINTGSDSMFQMVSWNNSSCTHLAQIFSTTSQQGGTTYPLVISVGY